MLSTKRRVIAQVLICEGCCCGHVERGRPAVPSEWLKEEWRKRGLLKRIHLTISGCLGPCDVPNVVAIVTQTETVWLGNISRQDQYQALLDWAVRSKNLGRRSNGNLSRAAAAQSTRLVGMPYAEMQNRAGAATVSHFLILGTVNIHPACSTLCWLTLSPSLLLSRRNINDENTVKTPSATNAS